jgi:predicted permease
VNLVEALAATSAHTSAGRGRDFRATLVAAEIALSLVLLSGAGLMFNSIIRLMRVNLGFNPKNVLAGSAFDLNSSPRGTEDSKRAALENSLRSIDSIPGVLQAGAVLSPPQLGFPMRTYVQLQPGVSPGVIDANIVAGDYFRAMQVPLLAGRFFTPQDREDTEKVVIVNETLARLLAPDTRVVGRYLTQGYPTPKETITIIGVVSDVRYSLLFSPQPEVYYPMEQFKGITPGTIVVRYEDSAKFYINGSIRKALQALNLNGIVTVASFEDKIAEQGKRLRFLTTLIGGAGLLGLFLGASGVLSVTAYAVRRRTSEFGVRIALGAAPGDVLRMILGNSARMVLIGAAFGIIIVLALGKALRSVIFEVPPYDPLTLSAVIVILGGTCLAASYIPARRAARIDPMAALRSE